MSKPKNKWYSIASIVLVILSFMSTWSAVSKLSIVAAIISIAAIDIYLVILVYKAAIFSIPKPLSGDTSKWDEYQASAIKYFPSRTLGLVLFAIFLIVKIYSFSSLYIAIGKKFVPELVCRLDAVCLSFGTMTTVSIVNYPPITASSKILMMSQMVSTMILFFAAFPLLINRLTNFKG